MKNKKRFLTTLVVVLLLSSMLATAVFGANLEKQLKAFYRNIKIMNNGQVVNISPELEPFIVNVGGADTTFVPLRALSEILGKEVAWNGANYTVDIKDKPDANLNNLMIQLTMKETEIRELKAKVEELEKKLEEKEKAPEYSISELQKYLNKQHGSYQSVYFDITLKSSKNDISVYITVDQDRYSNRWNSLTNSQIERYIKDIVKDIQKDYKDAYIHGYIEEYRTGYQLADFYTNKSGTPVISIGKKGYNTGSLSDLENYLNSELGYYWGYRNDIRLSWSGSNIVVDVYVDEYDWKNSSSNARYLEEIYRLIDGYSYNYNYDYNYDYNYGYIDYRDVIGYVYFTNDSYSSYRYTFDFNYDGSVNIR